MSRNLGHAPVRKGIAPFIGRCFWFDVPGEIRP